MKSSLFKFHFILALNMLFCVYVRPYMQPISISSHHKEKISFLQKKHVFAPKSRQRETVYSTESSDDRGLENLDIVNAAENKLPDVDADKVASKKLQKRWITGLTLGALGTIWIYSGKGPFSLGFLITSLIAQSEYYSIVKATGVLPAFKTGIISSLLCYVTAAMFPNYHELVMPLSATFLMIWLLVFNKKSASISEISTSLLGMFFLGYLPSYWVRLHGIGKLSNLDFIPPLGQGTWTFGSCVTWWTWTSIVFAGIS